MFYVEMLFLTTEEGKRDMNFNDIIKNSVLENYSYGLSLRQICVVLGMTLILGIYIFMVYRVAVNNEFYSKDFNRTLTLMAVVTAGIILAIQSNLVISLGMVGALSIVRFRTAIKSPIDLLFLFWSISIGIICGAGLYLVAGVLCIVVTIALFVLGKIESPVRLGLLIINCDTMETAEHVKQVLSGASEYFRMKNKTISRNSVEIIYEYKTKKEQMLEQELAQIDGVIKFAFMNYDRETRI